MHSIRFIKDNGSVRPMPMCHDANYSERLLRIPLDSSTFKTMKIELCETVGGIADMVNGASPLSQKTIERCYGVFNASMVGCVGNLHKSQIVDQ